MLVSVVFGSVLTALAGASGSELVDSDLSPEEVIERLKEVRKDWEEVEIEFAQFERRPNLYGPKPRLANWGRFVLRPGDCGEWTAFSADQKRCWRENKPEEQLVWTSDEFKLVFSENEVLTISRLDLPERNKIVREGLAQPTKRKPAGLLERLFPILVVFVPEEWDAVFPESPTDCLPLVFADDASALAERFDLSVKENDENIFLFARPRLLEDQRVCHQTAVCIDRQTFIPVAKRTVLPNGHDYFTWAVTSLRVNGKDIAVRRASTGEQSRE